MGIELQGFLDVVEGWGTDLGLFCEGGKRSNNMKNT